MGKDTVEGQCIVTRLDDGRLRVDRADPQTLISPELLGEIRAGRHHADVHLHDDLLYINGVNRQVVYRIGEKDPTRFGYRMAWPD